MKELSSRGARHAAAKQRSRTAKSMFNTIPIVLAGSMAMTLGFTGPLEPANAKGIDKPKVSPSELGKAIRDAFHAGAFAATTAPGVVTTASTAPATYRVVAGDTVSGVAGRFGLATASVLALNGLGWKSIIFPGQMLKLTNGGPIQAAPRPAPTPPTSGRYTILRGDTISRIAARFSVTTQSVLTANGLSWTSIIYPGQTLAIPSATTRRRPPRSRSRRPARAAPAPAPAPVQAAPAPAPAPGRARAGIRSLRHRLRRHRLLDRQAIRSEHPGDPDRQRAELVEHHLHRPHAHHPGRRDRAGRHRRRPRSRRR